MNLPNLFQLPVPSLPPLYTWPQRWKQVVLALAILAVILAYLLILGCAFVLLAILVERLGDHNLILIHP